MSKHQKQTSSPFPVCCNKVIIFQWDFKALLILLYISSMWNHLQNIRKHCSYLVLNKVPIIWSTWQNSFKHLTFTQCRNFRGNFFLSAFLDVPGNIHFGKETNPLVFFQFFSFKSYFRYIFFWARLFEKSIYWLYIGTL